MITTILRIQSDPDWHWDVSNTDSPNIDSTPGRGLTITYFDKNHALGEDQLSMGLEDALLLRSALNQLFPQ